MDQSRRESMLNCNCGRVHKSSIKDIIIEKGAINKVSDVIKENGFKKVFVLQDVNTYNAAGRAVEEIFNKESIGYISKKFKDEFLVPDEKALGEIIWALEPDVDVIVAIGSGTLNDLAKFISYQIGKPYFIVATAPSMDGFTSGASVLIVNDLKTTVNIDGPLAVIADTDILKEAPIEMIRSGVGDILGKYTCLCDWKISHIITGEYYCENVANMMREAITRCESALNAGKINSEKVVKELMEALVLSGICMEFVGTSRPASGAEHHLSHFWEMKFMEEGKEPILHGIKVGIGTNVIMKVYEEFMKQTINFERLRENPNSFDIKEWTEEIYRAYGASAAEVIELEYKSNKNSDSNKQYRVECIEQKFLEIVECIQQMLPSKGHIEKILKEIDAPYSPYMVGITEQEVESAIKMAKELRNRYTILQLIYDLELVKDIIRNIDIKA